MTRNKEAYDKYRKEWDNNARGEADKIFGTVCFICGKPPKNYRHALHRKDGTEHPDTNTAALAIKEPEKWVRLCYHCHIGVHFCMEFFGWSWEEIVSFLRTRL